MAKFGNNKMYCACESFDFEDRRENLKKYGRNTSNNKKWNKDVRRAVKSGKVDGVNLNEVKTEYREFNEEELAA